LDAWRRLFGGEGRTASELANRKEINRFSRQERGGKNWEEKRVSSHPEETTATTLPKKREKG